MLTDEEIAAVYRTAKTVAIVGASNDPGRDSFTAVTYLRDHGYTLLPVNPKEQKVAGARAYATLAEAAASVDGPIDVVAVFRRGEAAPEIACQVVEIGARVMWLVVDVLSPEAEEIATQGGVGFLQDRCVYTTHRLMARAGMLSNEAGRAD